MPAPQREKAGLCARKDAPRHRVIWVDIKRCRRFRRTEQTAVLLRGRGQQKARNGPGQSCLAHAARAGDQPPRDAGDRRCRPQETGRRRRPARSGAAFRAGAGLPRRGRVPAPVVVHDAALFR